MNDKSFDWSDDTLLSCVLFSDDILSINLINLMLCKSVKNIFKDKDIYQNTINIKKRYPGEKISRIFLNG